METTWQKGYSSKEYPKLEGNLEADVVIVGGGMTGILSAYLLAKAGKSVVVVEKETLKDSTTAYTTAFLTYEIDTALSDLVKMCGGLDARAVWTSGREAIDTIEAIIKHENISCEFMRCSEYLFANNKKGEKRIRAEAKQGKEFGFDINETGITLPFKVSSAIELKDQAKFHPLKFLTALRECAEREGAQFFEHTEVTDIEGSIPVKVKTAGGSVVANYVIVVTYNPFNKPRELYAKKAMYVSYVYELSIPKGVLPEALYIDSANPYHYFRVDSGEKADRLIIGGEDHRKEVPISADKNFRALEKYIAKMFPDLDYTIVTKWDGYILEPSDGLPLIGGYSHKYPNRFTATAFSGSGMTFSTVAATLFRSIILGEHNPYIPLYDPKRHFSLRRIIMKAKDYGGEFIGGALKNFFSSKK